MKSSQLPWNSVNECFPFLHPPRHLIMKPGHSIHSTIVEAARFKPQDLPSFPPCLRRGVDGIFRVRRRRSQGEFQDVREDLPNDKNWPRATGIAVFAEGGTFIG
jgi:hypothetical protein